MAEYMENPPIEFMVGDETFSLRMGFAAICALERAYDRPFGQVVGDVMGGEMRFTDLRTIFHACMLREGPTGSGIEDVSIEEAATIVDRIGFEMVGSLLSRALAECPLFAAPKPEKSMKPRVRGAGEGKRAAKVK